MQANYEKFIDRMIHRYEGGYCWDKADPGGPTNFGITCFDLAANRGQRMSSMATWAPIVRAMTLDEAEDIYKRKYAAKLKFDKLRSGVDVVILDYGVNSGIGRPIAVARRLVGLPGNNAVMDDALVEAINKVDPHQFIDAMCSERLRFMHAIRGGSAWTTFGRGWQSRVDDLRAYSHAIERNATVPVAPDLSKVPTPKATNAPAKAGATISNTTVASGGTALASGVPWYGVLGVVVAVLGIGALYEIYEINKANRLNNVVYA